MKNKSTNEHISNDAPQYRMRTECEADCIAIRAVLGPWLTSWREDRFPVRDQSGQFFMYPDMDVFFSMTSQAPTLAEIRWLLDCLVDCHVGAQSVNTAAEYDGERIYIDDMAQLLTRPSDEIVRRARDCAKSTKSCLRHEFSRLDEVKERLNAELGDDAAYRKRLAVRHAAVWAEYHATPEELASKALAATMGKCLAAAWQPSHVVREPRAHPAKTASQGRADARHS